MEDAPHGEEAGNECPFPQDVKSWVDSYKVSRRLATAELLSMLFEAFGVKYSIKEEQLDRDVDDVVVALVDLARAGEDYQFSRKNLMSFWNNLIIECQVGPLFDELLFPKCMDYIIALSRTELRDFRRTATFIGLQLVTSFIFVANTLNKSLSAQITSLEIMIEKILDELFVYRHLDTATDIRVSCVQSLGIWISSYPSLFLQNPYLEHLGCALNDPAAGVRKASLLALRKLYEMDKYVPSLGSFTARFSERIVEMGGDVDIPTALCAISLVKQLLRHQLMIPDYDLSHFYKLLVDEHQEIRRAIAELVYDNLIAQKFNSSLSGLTGHVDFSSEIVRMLKVLRECCIYQTQYIYAIDNVWEYMKAMKDWECIISMLLEEPQTWCTNDEDSTNLIELLFASVRKAVGEKIILLTDNRKLDHSEAQREILENNRKDITVAMMKKYPLLLRKFKADKGKVSSLVEIITFMKLELYTLEQQEQSFKDAVQFIKDAFFLNGEKEGLRSCVKAITFCASESTGKLQKNSREELKDLEDKLLEKLTSAIQDVKDGKDDSLLIVNLKRLYELQLSKHFPFEKYMCDELVRMLHNFRNLDEKVICFFLLNMHVDVVRSLRSIVDCETLPEASLSSLISKRGTLFKELSYFLKGVEVSGKYGSQLSLRICAILAEEWCAFEKSKFDSTRLEKLAYCPEIDMVDSFWKHCQGILNNSDETDEEDEENREYLIETNRDVAAIAACKLVTSDVVAKDYLGPEIISHLGMHGPSITDIIENFITNLRKTEADISNILLESLKRGYQRYANELSSDGGGESRVDKCLEVCRELAGQLSGMYIGAARNKHRSEILSVVNGGVDYAFIDPPKQLLFLEVAILPFATRLSVQDMRNIKLDVEERTLYVNTDGDPSGWLPCFTFVENLEKECANVVDDEEDEEDGEDEGHTMPNIDEVLNSRGPSPFELRSGSPHLSTLPPPQAPPQEPPQAPPQAIPRNRKHFDKVTVLSNRIIKKRLGDASDTLRNRKNKHSKKDQFFFNAPLFTGYPDDLCTLFEKDAVVSKQHFAFVDETISEREVSPTASPSPQASPTPSIPHSTVPSPTLNEREHTMPNGSEGERENFVHRSPQLADTWMADTWMADTWMADTNPSTLPPPQAPPQAIPRNMKHFDKVIILSNRIMKKRLGDASDTLRKRKNNPSKKDQFFFNLPLFTGYSDDLCSLLEKDCVAVLDGTIPEGASVSSPSVPQSPVADTVHLSPSPPPQARPRKRKHFDDVTILHDRINTLRKRNEFASSEIHIWRMNNQLKKDQILNEPLLTGYSDALRSLFEKGFKVMAAPVAREAAIQSDQ